MPDEKKIYPLAYELLPNLIKPLYYLGFPQRWKTELLQINRTLKPTAKDEDELPTNSLKRMILSWMDGVVGLSPLKKFSEDSHWLTSCSPYDDCALQNLCEYIKIWCLVTYKSFKTITPSLEKSLDDFCDSLKWEELKDLQVREDVRLTMGDGTVSGEAYSAIPLLAVNQLLGQTILLQNTPLRLAYAEKNELISHPLEDPKSHDKYSFWFQFSLQTTPPERHALLLCHMGIRRWIQSPKREDSTPYPSDTVGAHIQTATDKFCRVEIQSDYLKEQVEWNQRDRDCYNVLGFQPLPCARDIFCHPQSYIPSILLPYKNGMFGFAKSRIGTGVSVPDKKVLHEQILQHLEGLIISNVPSAKSIGKRKNVQTMNSPQEYESREDFRAWVRSCTDADEIHFELYCLWEDPAQTDLMRKIEQTILNDFGESNENSCMKICVHHKSLGDIALGLKDRTKPTHMRRCKEIAALLDTPQDITGSIVLIPNAEYYNNHKQGDPKQAIRNAFALTGRVVQFITLTVEEANTHRSRQKKEATEREKVIHCVYDLYRQLGIVSLIKFSDRKSPMLPIPCIGLHICTHIHGKQRKGRHLPLTVQAELQTGKVLVSCDAFARKTVTYREACLEMAQLFWKDDLEKLCTQASFQPAKQLLLKLKNKYRTPEEKVLLTVVSDRNTRLLWSGISDKELSEYEMLDEYRPKAIDSGKKGTLVELDGTGIRIFRIRANQEIPDYYTSLSTSVNSSKHQYVSTSGIFRYRNAFWSIMPRSKDDRFIDTLKKSRIDHPDTDYAEKDMSELYPIQLQSGDIVSDWVFFADTLRGISLQYNQSTILPLPLHLAKGLEEYLFDI